MIFTGDIMKLTRDIIIKARLTNNGLLKPFSSIYECVDELCGVQGQLHIATEIAVFNRVHPSISFYDLDKLYKEHKLVKGWGQRGTIHMYTINDWIHVSQVYFYKNRWIPKMRDKNSEQFDQIVFNMRKLGEEKKVISKREIENVVTQYNGDYSIEEPHFQYFLFPFHTMSGHFAGIPEKPHTKHYIHYSQITDTTLKHTKENRNASIQYFMRDYFRGYGPATLADFCHWSGVKKGLATTLFDEIKDEFTAYEYMNRTYYADPSFDIEALSNKKNQVFLLGKFDPLFVCYSHKDWIVNREEELQIWQSSARVEAVLLIDNKVYGTWRYTMKGKTMNFTFFLFHKLSDTKKKKIEVKAKKMMKFFEKESYTIEYQ